MKRFLRLLLLASLLTAALCVGALAAEPTEAGVYNVTGSGVTLTPQTAAGTNVSPTTPEGYDNYYAEAVRFGVEAADLTSGKQYLLLVLSGDGAPTEKNIVYIDQQAADSDGKVSFNAYPGSLTKGTYRVYIVGEGKEFDAAAPAASFEYYQPYTLGDVNGDGTIDSADALGALLIFVESKIPTVTERLAADVNKDGTVDSYDALQMLRYFVEEIRSFD